MHKAITTLLFVAWAFFVQANSLQAQFACGFGRVHVSYAEQIKSSEFVLLCHVTDRYERVKRQNQHPTTIKHVISDKVDRFEPHSHFNYNCKERYKPGTLLLLMGSRQKDFPKDFEWSHVSTISADEYQYFAHLPKLDAQDETQILYYLVHLASDYKHIAEDAYHRLFSFPPERVFEILHQLSPDTVRSHLDNEKPHQYHFQWYPLRLYTEGKQEDILKLQQLIRQRKSDIFDSQPLIAGMLLLSNEKGSAWLESNYFDPEQPDFKTCYETLRALSLIASLTDDKVVRSNLLEVAHKLLVLPEMSDLVISYFTQWEYWGATDQLLELYEDPECKRPSTKRSIIRYLLVLNAKQSGLPEEARTQIVKVDTALKNIQSNEPDVYKQAASFVRLP